MAAVSRRSNPPGEQGRQPSVPPWQKPSAPHLHGLVARATRASDSPNQQRVTVVPSNSSGTATVTKKMAKPTLVEERTAGRRRAAAISRQPPARAIVTQGRPACWSLAPKSTINATHVAPALAMGNAMRNEFGRQRPGSTQNQKRRHGKKSEEERQKENHEWQVRRIVLNHAPADGISRRSQQRGPGHPLPLVARHQKQRAGIQQGKVGEEEDLIAVPYRKQPRRSQAAGQRVKTQQLRILAPGKHRVRDRHRGHGEKNKPGRTQMKNAGSCPKREIRDARAQGLQAERKGRESLAAKAL